MDEKKSGEMISIIVPAYNEEGAVGEVLDHITRVMQDSGHTHEIIVVDDGSDDGTSKIVQEKNARLIRHEENMGYGASLKAGIRAALGDIIAITDADGTYPNEDLPKLIQNLDGYDMVVGARTGEKVEVPLIRKPAKWFITKLANYLSGIHIPDLNSGLRIFRKEVAEKYFDILPSGFSFTTTITMATVSNGHPVKFIPINYHRRVGKSKIHPIKDTLNFILLIFRTIMYFNPLKIFLPLAGLVFLAAIVVFIYGLTFAERLADVDITVAVLALAAFQTFVMGMLADLIDKRSIR